jgi:hypothetical protein
MLPLKPGDAVRIVGTIPFPIAIWGRPQCTLTSKSMKLGYAVRTESNATGTKALVTRWAHTKSSNSIAVEVVK